MNIALVYNNVKSKFQGGGYSFQEELLNNIKKLDDNNFTLNLVCLQKIKEDFKNTYKKDFKSIYNLNRNIFDRFRENLIRNFNFFLKEVNM